MKPRAADANTQMLQARVQIEKKRLFFSQLHLHGMTYRDWLNEFIDVWLAERCHTEREGKK